MKGILKDSKCRKGIGFMLCLSGKGNSRQAAQRQGRRLCGGLYVHGLMTVEPVAQFLAGFEMWHMLSAERNLRTGFWIATDPRWPEMQ